jgi:hypothetical protein
VNTLFGSTPDQSPAWNILMQEGSKFAISSSTLA